MGVLDSVKVGDVLFASDNGAYLGLGNPLKKVTRVTAAFVFCKVSEHSELKINKNTGLSTGGRTRYEPYNPEKLAHKMIVREYESEVMRRKILRLIPKCKHATLKKMLAVIEDQLTEEPK